MIQINKNFSNLIPPLTDEEFKGLEDSIINEGCRDALVLWNDFIIDGHNRFKICQKHKISYKTISKKFENENEVINWIGKNQLARRNLTDFQKLELSWKLAEYDKKEAEKNKQLSGGSPEQKRINKIFIKPHHTHKEVAKRVKLSQPQATKVKKIIDSENEEIKEKARSGEISINQAYNKINVESKIKERKETAKEEKSNPLPKRKYSVIYIDPPWKYKNEGTAGAAQTKYDTMSIKEMLEFKDENGRGIKDLAEKNCVLFMWVTNPLLEESFELINGLGFKYKTNFVWTKEKATYGALGFYIMGKHELLTICTKGSILPEYKPESIIIGENFKHSKKPECVYKIIEKMYPDCNYVELFARNTRKDWDSWGNEI